MMARYVWTATYHHDDAPDGGEDLGIFTSKRKAVNAARARAGLLARSRNLKWEVVGDGTLLRGDISVEVGSDVYNEPILEETHYSVQRRVVR